MAKFTPLILVVALFFSACETVPPLSSQALKTAKNIALVSAVEPTLVGQKIGITIFNNDSWIEENPDFDVNNSVLEAIRANLTREAVIVSGRKESLVIGRTDKAEALESLKPKLAVKGKEWGVDYILLIRSTQCADYIQNSGMPVAGVGHFYSHRDGIFCVLQLVAYDCKTGAFSSSAISKQVRKVPGLDWHVNWNLYPANEQRALTRVLQSLLNDAVAELLAGAGLNEKWKAPSAPTTNAFGMVNSATRNGVPEGNELDIVEGLTPTQVREAVRLGFKEHNWTIATDTDERIVGIYRKGKKDAVCAVTFTDKKILLAPEGYEIKDDGTRVKVAVYSGWHTNLKEAIITFLLKTLPASETSKP